MSDDRCAVNASNEEEKLEEKNCQDNDRSGRIAAAKVPIDDRGGESRDSLERNSPRTLGRRKDDNPGAGPEPTYSGEPIHHEWNVQDDGRGDKFISSEVAEDTGIRSRGSVERGDESDKGDDDVDDGNDDASSRRASFTGAMDKSLKSAENESRRIVGTSNRTIDRGQADRSSRDAIKGEIPSDLSGSPELGRKFSRTNNVRDDARRLKSATLDRMGKMFKLRSAQASSKEPPEEPKNSEAPEDSHGDQQLRKDKTNSLGRMFKLVDKHGEPRKVFPQSRTGSLGHILRRKSTGAEEDNNSLSSGNNRGVFSRLLSQWKNRSTSGNATVEPNLRSTAAAEDKSSSAKAPSTSRINLSSSRANPLQVPTAPAPIAPLVNVADVEYPA